MKLGAWWPLSRGERGRGRTILLTGVPRSGTTLTCFLLNKVPNTVALHEPISVRHVVDLEPESVRNQIGAFCRETRRSILTTGCAPSKQAEGKVPDNPIGGQSGEGGRFKLVSRGMVQVEQAVNGDFTLVLKHPGFFTSFLEALTPHYPLFAVIRNPLSVLSSWKSVPLPVQRGEVPAIQRADRKLDAALRRMSDVTDRQFYILSWYFERYQRLLAPAQVLRYEEIVASGGRALGVVVPAAAQLAEPLSSRNKSSLYDQAEMRHLADRLLASDGPYWGFYSRESVAQLVEPAGPRGDGSPVAADG
jgi:hypothetical protein